ncbi:ParB N-terminal domain-containing protein [Aetokthonos hydrillicola Thurmond2011]|jgi:ParB family chromosome partitioning protein|uniref:ParB N-terminal domain-containing protein n=1 Tax=Aetokthonos hydrillicola Thurmond2011 TaxID=2712845 RepID=A0AAP5IEF6_9CYAN|nr:ParB N-terminal domain-containing protein [Aetokthonos hydrillicola]MBO3463381.1 ParB N-terminal domain-containing protein [Aetokthonos hydrillicola CCALA 1050]MBW4586292.1 ParB N-terminal domain-containing protein [Aetokthonos hydrillicola CCALA 1050]MDR9897420.1 ParB N-terminal domain-containing protein [Aetokthonos hydrillicola Thurmond2011]
MPTVSIDQITIGLNRRPINDEKVAELMESIKANGLLNPITVDQNFNLIAGLHRLTACRLLHLTEIECNIITYDDADHARLAEIDENLIRNELEPLERSQLWLEREQILERLGLRAKPGDNQYTHKGSESISPPQKTTMELAKEVGYSERSFQLGKQIARDILPEVKEIIKDTPLAKSTTDLLKVARAGSKDRILAEQAEHAAEEAKARGEQKEAQRQATLAAQARTKQKELQMEAYKSAIAQKEAKLLKKQVQSQVEQPIKKSTVVAKELGVKVGEEWILGRHLIYCGDTAGKEFMKLLPSNAALAIATLSQTWNHDYLVNEARVVAVLRSEGNIYQFCSQNRMPFQYELTLGKIYIGIFSNYSISKPETPINIEGIEGIVPYLLNLYTSPNNFVIAPFMGNGEILIACERMGRSCFTGDDNHDLVTRGIIRWQNLTGKQAEKVG